jgi:transcriptional regulator with XRE-family HTH domain
MHEDPSATPEMIGKRLQLTRQALGVGQKEFAESVGISVSSYNHYEAGRHRPSLEAAIALRAKYGLTLDWIFCGDPSNLKVSLFEAIKAMTAARKTI